MVFGRLADVAVRARNMIEQPADEELQDIVRGAFAPGKGFPVLLDRFGQTLMFQFVLGAEFVMDAIHQALFRGEMIDHIKIQLFQDFAQMIPGLSRLDGGVQRVQHGNQIAMLIIDFRNSDAEGLIPFNEGHGGLFLEVGRAIRFRFEIARSFSRKNRLHTGCRTQQQHVSPSAGEQAIGDDTGNVIEFAFEGRGIFDG